MSAASATTPIQDGPLTHKQILTILSGLLMGMFLAALDQMIVATAIRTIGDDLNGLSAQAWVTTAFLITSTISTPLYGKLSDIYGRKPLFLFAIAVFILGSALCGLATSMYMLAAFRAFQGIGAGGLFSMALAILGDIVAAPRAGTLPGLLHGRVRHVQRARAGRRRVLRWAGQHLRHHRLALDLLDQRADRPCRLVRREPCATRVAPAPRSPHRLGWCHRARRRPGAAADHRRAGT